MHIEQTELRKAERAGWVFFVCLLTVFPVSYINAYCGGFMPRSLQAIHFFGWLDTTILFFPQYVFPHGVGSYDSRSGIERTLISSLASIGLSILFWIAVGLAFAWCVRRLRFRFTIPAAIITIFLLTAIIHILLYLVGIGAELDGP